MKGMFFVFLMLGGSLAWGQAEFNYEASVGDKILYLTDFKGAQVNLNIELKTTGATVLIVVQKEKSIESCVINSSTVKSIDTTGVKTICVIHREKKIIRLRKKFEKVEVEGKSVLEKKPKRQRKSASKRVTVSSGTSSTATTTTVTSI